jgi:CheY-like chemotaxis protein
VPGYSTKGRERGIGLTVVERIVNDHGGAIAVDSAPGRGTTFRLRLPRSQPPAAGDDAGLTPCPRCSSSTTSPNIRDSLKGALGREGYQVDVAATLAEGRAKLREACDVLLLDVRLPDGSGLDLLADVRASAPETTVIVMSGHATIDDAVRATRLGAY